MNMRPLVFILICAIAVAIPAKALEVREVPTQNIPAPGRVTVAVPDGYADSDTATYPVVYLLNGHGGDHRSWSHVIDLDSVATAYRTIIVCPAGLNSWYFDSPVDSTLRMESYITRDLIPWTDANYRTRPLRTQRAITGLSMGGHGALWLATRHPDLFANAGSTSGGVDIRPFPQNWSLPRILGAADENPDRWADHTVATAVKSLSPGTLNIIFDCGYDDFFYSVNCALHRDLLSRGIAHTFLTQPGDHSSAYWSRSILPQFQFFRSHFYCD